LSFSGARSGGKGTKTKKVKKQKREFHTSKKRATKEEKEVDVGAARARVLEGLAHLGKQKFTPGPGGYDLKHWLKSLNRLLDDFESKIKDGLPEEYHRKREEISTRFSAGADISKIESEVEAIRKEESEIMAELEREKKRVMDRSVAIRVEKEGKAKEIEGQMAELKSIEEKRKSASFFSKLVGRSGPPKEPVEQKIKELEKGSAALEEEAQALQRARSSLEREGGTPSGPYEKQWLRVDEIAARLKELEAETQEKMQLAKEREAATAELSWLVGGQEPKSGVAQEQTTT
jgi:hypothetical protein